jgi:hypothetical protein
MLYLLQGAACGGSLALNLGTDCLPTISYPPAQVTRRYGSLGVAAVWLQLTFGLSLAGFSASPRLEPGFRWL